MHSTAWLYPIGCLPCLEEGGGVCQGCARFAEIWLKYFEFQILWSLSSVDFHTLTLQLPIQTPNLWRLNSKFLWLHLQFRQNEHTPGWDVCMVGAWWIRLGRVLCLPIALWESSPPQRADPLSQWTDKEIWKHYLPIVRMQMVTILCKQNRCTESKVSIQSALPTSKSYNFYALLGIKNCKLID